jgi:hypothetical protein
MGEGAICGARVVIGAGGWVIYVREASIYVREVSIYLGEASIYLVETSIYLGGVVW